MAHLAACAQAAACGLKVEAVVDRVAATRGGAAGREAAVVAVVAAVAAAAAVLAVEVLAVAAATWHGMAYARGLLHSRAVPTWHQRVKPQDER